MSTLGPRLLESVEALESVASGGLFGTNLSKYYASSNVLICMDSCGYGREGA